ncbi:hypothetical protein B2J86_16045 [Acidovorax sp. SRB_14]|uniref:helix-turn-helix transcriptional regulator n=1 Tax=Acidovorax sp. SRB_14 TaxID=1962699 RepID=UPI0015661E90|nr:AlpA family phage regulatory protein [Acidovorax sp. SRB_14]NMM82423.1 hypothetical protein [Acidovorax sp. SRB_14]
MANIPHQNETLLRLPQVLARFPVSRSGWYAGMKRGKYPAPIKSGPRTAMWRASEIDSLIATIGN